MIAAAVETASLVYESRSPDALEPGEVVLWQGSPLPRGRPPSTGVIFLLSSAVLVALVGGAMLVATSWDMPGSSLLVLTLAIGVAAAFTIYHWAHARHAYLAKLGYRITTHRITRVGG